MEILEHITLLLIKQWNEPLTEAEQRELEDWLAEDPSNRELVYRLNNEPLKEHFEIFSQCDSEEGLRRLHELLEEDFPVKKATAWWRTSVAAAVIMVAGIGVYWLVTKAGGDPISQSTEVIYKTITVPRGKQSFVVLPDSTQVWLNAGSTLRYPDHFPGKERGVELTGEAFFDVTKTMPGKDPQSFTVRLKGMEVMVSGTRFNVKSYDEDSASTTTLLEGSIEIRRGGHVSAVRPGEQVSLNLKTEEFTITKADTSAIKSWMTDWYVCHNSSLPTLLKDLERWYNIEVVYNPSDLIGLTTIDGDFPKSASPTQVAQIIGIVYGNLEFTVAGQKLIIRKKR